ncbi:MAG: hypothetical protein COX92_00320 [Candidatus Nealsonbacteria bacterium CG_4_10_14_0_2_um_filter_40_15]|uniref:Type 4a pilus biogenesis protein PilO n=1 Tax=Candidatus Nealsonbacteria bacterium CG_4_10_14_0_2_um_filter_40_15 TaxID=1974682 RepID=A0A2M7UV17_9BACT|nr:MAG: hypothetical protein COX92_00320 [Candidatus Nealsonbacteria bacterium CG_4_10_14_0_2_um_filter_40_15]
MTITRKINLSIFIFVVSAALIAVFIIYPFFNDIKIGSKELILQKENLAILEAQMVNLENFKIIYKNLEEISEKIDGLSVNPEVPVEFIGFLENTAEEYHLKIEISPSSARATEKDLWSYITFQISTSGYFTNFLKFQKRMENSPYLIEIQNLSIGRLTELGEIQASFTIKVFTK